MGGRLAIGLVAAAYVVILFIGAFEDRREAVADFIGVSVTSAMAGELMFVGENQESGLAVVETMTPSGMAVVLALTAILWLGCLIRPVPAVQAHAAINESLHKVGKAISIGALILMVCFILLQVFMRYALNDAPNWTEEAARFGMLWMTGLMAPIAYRHGGFVAIDMLERALAPRLSAVLTLILFGMSLAVLLVMWDKGLNNHVDTLSGRGCSSTLRWPFGIEIGKCRAKFSNYYQYIALWIGINLLILACVELILRQILKLFGKDTGLAPLGDEDMASASVMLIWFLPLFLVILMIGTPVVFALLFAPGFMTWVTGNEKDLAILYRNVYTGIDSFPLMALPFFMLAGEVMNRGGITTRLVEFSQAFMGHLRGGLAQVNILSSILFAGLSGSAVADTSALGSTLIPAMEKNGYTRKFAAAITAASSVIGPIIPPSGIMIIYAYVMGESVAALFLAGIVPGVLVGVGLMVMVRLMADRYDLPKAERIVTKNQTIAPIEFWLSFILARINLMGLLWAVYRGVQSFSGYTRPEGFMLWGTLLILLILAHFLLVALRGQVSADFRTVCKKGVVPLQTPIIILGGILIGVMTPTEASTIAVAYALLVSVFVLKSLTWADFFDVLQRSALASASVLLLVGAAVAFKTIVATSGAATTLADLILGLSENPLILLFLINILLFIVGMFLDAGPAIIILGPILGPIFVDIGVHPVHFAIIMSVNLTVGLATPPMGLVLFVASTVSREKVETIAKAILPFLAVEVAVIFLITFFPQISMTVPYLADFLGCAPDSGYMACISPGPPTN